MPNIARVCYIEILHKITNRNTITLVRYLAQTKTDWVHIYTLSANTV